MTAPLATFGIHRAITNGDLMMEGIPLKDIAARFGTPCFCLFQVGVNVGLFES